MNASDNNEAKRYAARGVSSAKDEVQRAVDRLDPGLFPGAFCKVLPDYFGGDPEWCSIAHADGAGTKSALAYLYWKETGDSSVWKGIAQDAVVMNLDDLLCVGVVDRILVSSSIDRNKHVIPGEVIAAIIEGTEQLLQKLRDFGIGIYSGGGETADVGDTARTIVVNASFSARLPRSRVIDNSRIRAGDVIVGLASFGRAEYEDCYNAGMGSNGLTSARHDLLAHIYADRYPETYSPETPRDLVYCGRFLVTDPLPGAPINVGRAILSPTRTYAPIVVSLLSELEGRIHGMVHCSGGGQTKVLKCIPSVEVLKDNLFPCPPLFKAIQEGSRTPWREMYQTFNMGHRLEVFVSEGDAAAVMAAAHRCNVEARVIGRVRAARSKQLKILSEFGEFVY